jgi:dephospho-CoA kinase
MTIIVGLTGGIGMGKSTCAKILRNQGVPVFEADRYVHRLLNKGGGAVAAVARVFPATFDARGKKINRQKLGRLVFGSASARKRLEAIIHPLVRTAEERFIRRARRAAVRLAVLDIPLLFETRADALVDQVWVVTAPSRIQAARVLARQGMTPQKWAAIRAAQMNNRARLRRADAVINTHQPLEKLTQDLQARIARL